MRRRPSLEMGSAFSLVITLRESKPVKCLLKSKEKVSNWAPYPSYSLLVTVPFGLLVWSTGLASNPLIDSITGFKKHKTR
jgi:hypothetical protein